MKYLKIYNWAIIIVLLTSCGVRQQVCDTKGFKELDLQKANVALKLPEFIITDTVRWGDETRLLDYKLRTLDSSLIVFAGVTTFGDDPYASFDIKERMESEKEQIQSGQDSMTLITQTFKIVDSIKIGYVKYLDRRYDKRRYESRIFFYKEKLFVDIWLIERYISNEKEKHSLTDCILENIKFKG